MTLQMCRWIPPAPGLHHSNGEPDRYVKFFQMHKEFHDKLLRSSSGPLLFTECDPKSWHRSAVEMSYVRSNTDSLVGSIKEGTPGQKMF